MSVKGVSAASLKINKEEVFNVKKSKSLNHESTDIPNMTKIAIALINKLPTGCRIGYTYKARSGKILTFPSAFFKRVSGKSQEFMVVQSNKKQVAIMISNITGIWVDRTSLKQTFNAKPPVVTIAQLVESMKILEKKLDRLLRR